MNIESLISDLAFILLLGAAVTVLFKWIKQPVVLGYIVAGFLASPHFVYLPSVTTEENIDFWAEIGIVVLLFSLGLEFSFKKLISSGGSAIVTALTVIAGMMGTGFIVGHALHFDTINCLFLGGMLSMSSTTIIIKAFSDLGLRQKKFASLVLAVLIVEDLFAVVMMVVLSSIAINNSVEGTDMLFSVAKLLFFLIIWFAVGVYVLPSALNRTRRFLNSETLLIVSMGLCLGMAVFSVYCGFSLALGAFVMGSILAGTSYAERIEHVVTPVKDLFGAVFFISVGMMVQPDILARYWGPILLLSAVVILGMITFGTFGMLITGQTLRVAIRSGFSLTQIGEFAFIIATLGMSLGVLDNTIYPIVVAVSVITTFTTPMFIKVSAPAAQWVEQHLPERLHFLITRYHKEVEHNDAAGASWKAVLRRYLWRTVLYSVVLLAIAILSRQYALPYCQELLSGNWGRLVCVTGTLVAMSPFLMALMMPLSASSEAGGEEAARAAINAVPRTVLTVFRFIIALVFVAYVISEGYSTRWGVLFVTIAVILVAFIFSRSLRKSMARIENRFIDNLNERELRRTGKNNALVNDLHLAYITVGDGAECAGERLMDSNLRREYGVNIVSIQRGPRVIPIPDGRQRLYPGDVLGVLGTEEQIDRILPVIEKSLPEDSQHADLHSAQLTAIVLTENSPLTGQTPQSSELRNRYEAIVVAVDRGEDHIDTQPDLVFQAGDMLWLVGDPDKISKLK